MGVLGDLEDCWLVLGFVLGSWRVRGSQRSDHRGISRSLGHQEGFCEGGQGLCGAKIDLGGF